MPIRDLTGRLQAVADERTKTWFENYLKGVIAYRGVKTPVVRRIVGEWRSSHRLEKLPAEEQLELAATLIRSRHAEDKFAGILYIQRFLLDQLEPETILGEAEALFAERAFFDWSTTDWFSVRVLGPMIVRHGEQAAKRIAGWHSARDLWHRRSAIVPFRAVVGDTAYHPRIAATIALLVHDSERFIQTGIGWVLSDLSKVHPVVAATLVERHFAELAPEVIRRHTRYLAEHERYKAEKRRKR